MWRRFRQPNRLSAERYRRSLSPRPFASCSEETSQSLSAREPQNNRQPNLYQCRRQLLKHCLLTNRRGHLFRCQHHPRKHHRLHISIPARGEAAEAIAMVAAITGAWVDRVWVATHSTDSAEAAGASRSWRLEKRGQRAAKTDPRTRHGQCGPASTRCPACTIMRHDQQQGRDRSMSEMWLRGLGLGQYEAAFRENETDNTV